MTFSLLLDGIVRIGRSAARRSVPRPQGRNAAGVEASLGAGDEEEEMTVAFTAQLCAASRALEHEREGERLFDDPLSAVLAGPVALARARARVRSQNNSDAPRRSPRTAIRTRYFDQFIATAVEDLARSQQQQHQRENKANGNGIEDKDGDGVQLVLLGAGMDTRAYRLNVLQRVKCVYEVDAPEVMQKKLAALAELKARQATKEENSSPEKNAQAPSLRARAWRIVQADLVEDDWPRLLRDVGFDDATRTIWVLEGVVYYLEHVQVLRLFRQMAEMSACGSRLAFSAVTMLPGAKTRGPAALFRSAMPDPERFARGVGFLVDRVDVFGGPRANFERCFEAELRQEDDWKGKRATIYVTATKEHE